MLKIGRELVESFVKGRFLGEVKFVFLNVVFLVRYDLYNFVVVFEEMVNFEYYVFSSYCILYVNFNGLLEF